MKNSKFQIPNSKFIKVGIGDDACVFKDGTVVTTDAYLEDIHFSLNYFNIYEIGQRVVCGTLSDIAAMAAKPIAVFVSALLPPKLEKNLLKKLYSGMQRITNKFSCEIAGGDIVAYPKLGLILSAVGKTKNAKLRSSAKPGDYLYITGYCGLAETGRLALKNKLPKNEFTQSIKKHTCPIPRINEALKLKQYINALIDTSDGLSTDAFHIVEESKVKIKIFANKLPIHQETINFSEVVIARNKATDAKRRWNEVTSTIFKQEATLRLPHYLSSLTMTDFVSQLVLNGGEDYELLFTSKKKNLSSKILGIKITQIGLIEKGRGIFLVKDNKEIPILPKGYDHFIR